MVLALPLAINNKHRIDDLELKITKQVNTMELIENRISENLGRFNDIDEKFRQLDISLNASASDLSKQNKSLVDKDLVIDRVLKQLTEENETLKKKVNKLEFKLKQLKGNRV